MGYAGSGMGGLMQGWRQADMDQRAEDRNDAYLKTQELNQTRAQQGIDEWSAGAENREMDRQFKKSKMVATQAMQVVDQIPDQNWGNFVGRVFSELPVLGKVQADPTRSVLVDEEGKEHQIPMDKQSMKKVLAGFADPEGFKKIKTAEMKRANTPTQYVDAQGNVKTMLPGEAGTGWTRADDQVTGMGLRKGEAEIRSVQAQGEARRAQRGYYDAQQSKAGRVDVAPGHVVFGPDGKEIARGLQAGTGKGGGKKATAPNPFNKQNIEQALETMTEGYMLSKGFQKKNIYNDQTRTTTTEFVDAQGQPVGISVLQKADKISRLAVNKLQTGQARNIVEAQEMAERTQTIYESAANEFTSRTGFSPKQKPSEFKRFLLEYSRGLDTGYRQRIPIGTQR
jgi:hypothetical protein